MSTETDAVRLELPYAQWYYILDALKASHDYDLAYCLGQQLAQYGDTNAFNDAAKA